jgi:hypothetical protein
LAGLANGWAILAAVQRLKFIFRGSSQVTVPSLRSDRKFQPLAHACIRAIFITPTNTIDSQPTLHIAFSLNLKI